MPPSAPAEQSAPVKTALSDQPKKPDGELTAVRRRLDAAYREFLGLVDVARKAAAVVADVGKAKPDEKDDKALATWHKHKAEAEASAKEAAGKVEEKRPQLESQLVGVRVTYWFPHGPTGFRPMTGTLTDIGRDGKADLVCIKAGYRDQSPRRGVPFSDTPKVNHWTWMQNGLI